MSELYEVSPVYHLKVEDNTPQSSIARCNSKKSYHWKKYKKQTFITGKKFSTLSGDFVKITGKPCKRCAKLLNN